MDWKIVDETEAVDAIKARALKEAKTVAAIEALMKLKSGKAIRIKLPEQENRRQIYEADHLRGWWRTKMRRVSKIEGFSKAFTGVTSSDGKFFFIQRNPKSS